MRVSRPLSCLVNAVVVIEAVAVIKAVAVEKTVTTYRARRSRLRKTILAR
jgi:hypothetical protein